MDEELRKLNIQRAKLLNASFETIEEYEEVQDKIAEIELKIKELTNDT